MNIKSYTIVIVLSIIIAACGTSTESGDAVDNSSQQASLVEKMEFHLTAEKYNQLNFGISILMQRNMSASVEVSGSLEVPPQNEAIVTAIVGANVEKILVIEGEQIAKGQVLAYLKHPELITLQTNYITVINELGYMKSSYERQKKLYDENVGSGKDLQESESKYMAKKGEFKGLEYKLKMLGLKPESIANGNIEELIPVRAPIDGYIQNVRVKTSQFVQPEREMFEIINIEHVHADLMVFEKDVHLVKKGQKIIFHRLRLC